MGVGPGPGVEAPQPMATAASHGETPRTQRTFGDLARRLTTAIA